MKLFLNELDGMECSDNIRKLRDEMQGKPQWISMEQAKIITETYKQHDGESIILKRAHALKEALLKIEIEIDAKELIVGNRAKGSKTGVVSPEAGVEWVKKELYTFSTRPQDKFLVKPEDIEAFEHEIYPYWSGHTLESTIYRELGEELLSIEKVVKLNQKDHAQGHICPNVQTWLTLGPEGLRKQAQQFEATAEGEVRDFYAAVQLVMEGAVQFIGRYADLARKMASTEHDATRYERLIQINCNCASLSLGTAQTFHEAVQSVWFLFVILQMESNASSFSPGRLDQILYKYYAKDIRKKKANLLQTLDILECFWIKFNEIVYLRNQKSASFFAGFPIGFNIAIGGQKEDGTDATNELTYLMLKTQEHMYLPQPNLSARMHTKSPNEFIERCARVIGKGSGMPQIFNDTSVIPALENIGIRRDHAMNYAITGCVEITTVGNNLGYSDAAMFNMVKVLELTLNDGICMQTQSQIGLQTGCLTAYDSYALLEEAYAKQMRYFVNKMVQGCEIVEKAHIEKLPSPFLSAVVDDCMEKGIDITTGGALYNYSGLQAIQAANLADCFAALKELVFDKQTVSKETLLKNLRENYPDESLRNTLLTKAPKYGNDVEWVDLLADKWIGFFSDELKQYKNYRGGAYHAGLYTVSAHVPMGANVAATPDGRRNGEPLADGGLSAVSGRDVQGPTALLRTVERVHSEYGSNGTLLNMKFAPSIFETAEGFDDFCFLIKSLTHMKVHHVQFNVFNRDDLLEAQKHPDKYRNLIVRVAGYSAYFVELAEVLQNEILSRTEYGH